MNSDNTLANILKQIIGLDHLKTLREILSLKVGLGQVLDLGAMKTIQRLMQELPRVTEMHTTPT